MVTPDLRRAVKGMANNEILIPAIQAALNSPTFKGFDIKVEEWTARPPDGYFHPSTQSTWNVRQLALYLMAPKLVVQERMQVTGVLAITQGHFWHMFLQHIARETGYLIDDEIGFTDEEYKRRGHMDGLLRIKGVYEGLEIKTINQFKINKIISEEALKELKYQYWCQAQEYLDVFELPRMRFLFISPSYPFPMKEFIVKADPVHQASRRKDYRDAISIYESGQKLPLPSGGCCGQVDTCALKYACKFGENLG
jgi:hypothetical protein